MCTKLQCCSVWRTRQTMEALKLKVSKTGEACIMFRNFCIRESISLICIDSKL